MTKPLAVISGASSGIGAATAIEFAKNGYNLSLCARRENKLHSVAEECKKQGATVYTEQVDVCDEKQRKSWIENTLKNFPSIDVFVSNAGGARGVDKYENTTTENIRTMFEVNVFASFELTKLVLKVMKEQNKGDIVFIGSIAGHQPYEGGSAYCASKHAQRAMVESLRQEICDTSIRVSTIDPGMVNTEFSIVRLGDKDKADAVYNGITPLVAQDIAESIYFICSRPSHVNISELKIFPVHQADARKVYKS